MSETLYAVDVFSLVFQVFHAIPPMTSPTGQPTNAVFGFTRDLLTIIRDKQPDYIICAMDTPGPGVREEIYEDYKANREEMPDELQPQIPVIIEIMEGFGIPVLSQEGWEADDILATLARRAEEEGITCHIVTNDKDARQLITPLVTLYNVRKDRYLDEAFLIEDWDIRPDQVVDFQALVGDSVDNVPGVPLVGPKKAGALLNQFGTLEDVLAHADEAPGKKLRENLKTYADQARISRKLVELNAGLDIELNWHSARVGGFDVPALAQTFRECGFRRFIDDVRKLAPEDESPRESLFAENEPHVDIVGSEEQLQEILKALGPSSSVALRLETTGLDAMQSDVAAITVADDDRNATFIPLDTILVRKPVERETAWECIRLLLETKQTQLCGHDVKSTLIQLQRAGLDRVEPGLDTMVASYLLSSGSRSHKLSNLVDQYFGSPLRALSRAGGDEDDSAPLTTADLAVHSAEEACLTLRVAERMRSELQDSDLWDLYDSLERPLITVLAELEHTGIRVDADELDRQNDEISERIEQLVQEIHDEAGEEFNVDSPKQLRTILFDRLGLPVLKKTKTGPSTDQDVLEQLAAIHPLPAKIIEHRHLVKLKGTYLDALPLMINPGTGRIHAKFHQAVAATGRLSSSHPNLQNIPIRTPEGERIRRAFVPGEPGWTLICADYSQIELRMVAHYSGDAALQQAFTDGVDIHTAVAADVFNVSVDDVDSAQRRIAKAVNFGVIYGQTPFGLSAALGISREEAAAFINDYFERYAGVAAFIDETLQKTARDGFAETILGRRRAISGIRARRGSQLNMPERTAVNTVIQGSAADLIKRAMINIHRRLKKANNSSRMLLQIHDELVFETPFEHAESLAKLVRHEMENAMQLSVPITVDLAQGDNWLDAKS